VEFSSGGMAWLANPLFLSAGIMTLATFFVLLVSTGEDSSPAVNETSSAPADHSSTADQPGQLSLRARIFSPWRAVNLRWLAIHLFLIGCFVWITLLLHTKPHSHSVSWLLAFGWFALGAAVAISVLRAFLSFSSLWNFVRRYALQASVAAAVGVSMLLLITPTRNLWTHVDDPGLTFLAVMLDVYPGNANINTTTYRWPIVGTKQLSLIVTPACSELESLVAFLLLGGTLWVARAEQLSAWRYIVFLSVGLLLSFSLLFVRLYLLVLLGQWASDAYVSVNLAHSRIGTLLLMLCSLLMVYLGGKLAAKPVAQVMEQSPAEETAEMVEAELTSDPEPPATRSETADPLLAG